MKCTSMFLWLLPVLALAGGEETTVFQLPTLEGWRTETIPFPLEFAPGLAYEGLEELRFAPGMFEVDQPDFWTYAFLWWIEPGPELSAEILARDLEAYFTGLAVAVAGERRLDTATAEFACRLEETDVGFTGTARTFDPFVTAANLDLNVRIRQHACPDQERLAVLFELSPQPFDHGVWTDLAAIREGFGCGEADSANPAE